MSGKRQFIGQAVLEIGNQRDMCFAFQEGSGIKVYPVVLRTRDGQVSPLEIVDAVLRCDSPANETDEFGTGDGRFLSMTQNEVIGVVSDEKTAVAKPDWEALALEYKELVTGGGESAKWCRERCDEFGVSYGVLIYKMLIAEPV